MADGALAYVMLSGMFHGGTECEESDWRSKYFSPENLKKTMARVDKLKPVVPKGIRLPEVALRFILSDSAVSTTIAGMRKPDHVRQNIAASDAGPLDAGLLQTLKGHRWDRTPQPWSD
jgi:aryl-alcohol dehydrogenase-like predicted oxidoreductase